MGSHIVDKKLKFSKIDLMHKKGIIHVIPLGVIIILLVSGLSILSIQSEQNKKEAVGKVLSSSDNDKDDNSGKGSSGSVSGESGKSGSSNSDDDDDNKDSSGPGSADSFKVESKSGDGKIRIKTKSDNEAKVEIRTNEGRFKTETKDGEEKTEIRTGGLKIKWERKGDRFELRVKNEDDEDVELEDEDEDELLDELEEHLEDDDIQIATGSAELGFVQRGRRVRTNFPLSINPLTGELFVSTPAGDKVVTILPDVAVANMIRAGILTRVDEEPVPGASPTPEATPSAEGGTPSAEPGEGTPSASVEGAGIELTEEDGQPVYIISGVKSENFVGLFPVDVKLKTVVSAQTGGLLDIEQGFLSKLLDLLSF